jgi:hypothetical protein
VRIVERDSADRDQADQRKSDDRRYRTAVVTKKSA